MGMARTLGDGAGSAADEAMHVSSTRWACVEGRFGHLLALLEVRGAVVAEVLVRRHTSILAETEARHTEFASAPGIESELLASLLHRAEISGSPQSVAGRKDANSL